MQSNDNNDHDHDPSSSIGTTFNDGAFIEYESDIIQLFIHMHMFSSNLSDKSEDVTISSTPAPAMQHNIYGFAVWEPFPLYSFVDEDGVEKKLLITPILGGVLAVPIISNTDLNKHVIPTAFLCNSHDLRHCDASNINVIRCCLAKTLRIWQMVVRYFIQKPFSSFSFNEMVGTAVLFNTLKMYLNRCETVGEIFSCVADDSDNCFIFEVRYRACRHWFEVWNEALITEINNLDTPHLWKKSFDDAQSSLRRCGFADWLLCRVGLTT